MSVTIEIITNPEEFYGIRDEWNRIADQSNPSNPFLSHEWLSSWWKGYGKDKKLCILRFKDAQGKTIGFAPFMEYKTKLTKLPVSCMGFLANHWTQSDILSVNNDYLTDIVEALVNHLRKCKKTIILSYFSQHSYALPMLLGQLQSRKIKHATTIKNAPFLGIEGTWQDYLKQRSYRFRSEYKKKRQLLESNGKLELVRMNKDFTSPSTINMLTAVSAQSWQGQNKVAVLSKPEGGEFYNNLFTAWGTNGVLNLSLLKLNEKPVSYIVGFRSNGNFHVFDTAFDSRYNEMSPGLVIHNMLLEQLFLDGVKIFDFGYAADYKTRWTETSNRIVDVTIFPDTIEGFVLKTAHKLKRAWKKDR